MELMTELIQCQKALTHRQNLQRCQFPPETRRNHDIAIDVITID